MSRRLSGFIALALIASLLATLSGGLRFLVLDWPFNAAELLGWTMSPLAFSACVAAIAGFVGGAVRTDGFRPTFFWTSIVLLGLFCVAHIGLITHYVRY
jgi:hypothetical protein